MNYGPFDPHADVSITWRRLPHWEQAGAYHFVTFRTADSLPVTVLQSMQDERLRWLISRGIDARRAGWKKELATLSGDDRVVFRKRFSVAWQRALDAGYGRCVLRRPEVRQIVVECLRHFDQDRYSVEAFVVMPNHVHLLAGFPVAGDVRRQCRSWKGFTARRINQLLQRSGPVWQTESWDHIVRSVDSFERIREYIVANPQQARLEAGEYEVYDRSRGD